MDDFDLNIDNYNLEDILNLFHLTYEFKPEDMKKAKSMALKTHPDKSRLPKDVFLFFMKAYKMLEAIYEYRYKKEQCAKNQKYKADIDTENKQLLKILKDTLIKYFAQILYNMNKDIKMTSFDLFTIILLTSIISIIVYENNMITKLIDYIKKDD